MNALQKRVSKLERPIGAGEQLNCIVHMIEPGTMRVTSRLRLIAGAGVVEIDEEGNAIEARSTELETAK
ncbi:MAG: hypothetical protein CRU72_13100 [Candidatus Accumulibacter phosphatis]|jgi:hypothetical protein|uniref:hypothetical protein n=1 Tax=Candidatus Accumulibacter sp. ACC005 TaxID=2823331 RepID=UPI0012C04D92|nr:hypothetical protein [Candidatus Accumulibacter sp. ACC005]MQM35340.1 hypothetical protein [Candidatus Accumulibacter phosphatis]